MNGTVRRACAVALALWAVGTSVGAAKAAGPRPASRNSAPQTLAGHSFLTIPGQLWKLAWRDEFTGSSLDPAKWTIGLPWVGDDGTHRHHNNQYASYIMDDDVVVSAGTLKLLTRRRDVANPSGRVYRFTEGLITTSGKFAQRYGYFEVSARAPVEAGPGLWPAFWMLSEGWPPEMDVAELWTSDNRSHQGLAYRGENGGVSWDDQNTRHPLPTGFHTYGMEWGPGYQVYNIDGVVTKLVYGPHVPDVPMYLLLNSGVESHNPPTAATAFPNAFEIDYVRVYARPDLPSLLNAGFEGDSLAPWTATGRVLAVAYGAHAGRQALRMDAGPAEAQQVIYGLKPETTYTVSAWARVASAGEEARVGVRGYGGDDKQATVSSTRYARASVTFTTGPGQTTAVVYCQKPAGTSAAWFDDVAVSPAH